MIGTPVICLFQRDENESDKGELISIFEDGKDALEFMKTSDIPNLFWEQWFVQKKTKIMMSESTTLKTVRPTHGTCESCGKKDCLVQKTLLVESMEAFDDRTDCKGDPKDRDHLATCKECFVIPSEEFEHDGVWCSKCKCRTCQLFYRIGVNNTMITKKVGRVCPSCNYYQITDSRYRKMGL